MNKSQMYSLETFSELESSTIRGLGGFFHQWTPVHVISLESMMVHKGLSIFIKTKTIVKWIWGGESEVDPLF